MVITCRHIHAHPAVAVLVDVVDDMVVHMLLHVHNRHQHPLIARLTSHRRSRRTLSRRSRGQTDREHKNYQYNHE